MTTLWRRDRPAAHVREDHAVPDVPQASALDDYDRGPTIREAAEEFLAWAGGAGWDLGWGPPSVVELDRFIDQVGSAHVSTVAAHLAAYFGELLVRNGAGEWTAAQEVRTRTGYALSPRAAVDRLAADPAAPPLATVYVFAMVGHPTLEESAPDFGADPGARMQTWAAIFTHDAALHGMLLDYDEESLEHVESMCEVLHVGRPDTDAVDELALTMGAYLGEVVISTCGGVWTLDEAQNALAVELPSGTRCYPLRRVANRLREGAEHDLRLFHCLATVGAPTDMG